MKLWMVYPLLILSSRDHTLPADLERALLEWLWNREEGIYYVYDGRLSHFPEISSKRFSAWLDAVEVLSNFRQWRAVVGDAIAWIWAQQNREGHWDFGSHASGLPHFPLSDSWRKPLARQIDCSTRVLSLLRKYHEPSAV